MPRLVTYRCPDCTGQFDFLHHPVDEPPPEFCPLCKAYMGDGPPKAPVISLNLRTAKNQVPDRLFRTMEAASEARAQDAAEMLGESASDMSVMKITDLKDNTREGDTHAVLPTPSVATQNLTHLQGVATGSRPDMEQQAQAAEWRAATVAGPAALSTRTMVEQMQRTGKFREIAAVATRTGQLAKG